MNIEDKIIHLINKFTAEKGVSNKLKLLRTLKNIISEKDIYEREYLSKLVYIVEENGFDREATFLQKFINDELFTESFPLQVCSDVSLYDKENKKHEVLPYIIFNTRNHYERFINDLAKETLSTIYLPEDKFKDEYGNHMPNPEYLNYKYNGELFAKNGYRDYSYLCHARICTNDIDKLNESVIKLLKTKYKELYYEEIFD